VAYNWTPKVNFIDTVTIVANKRDNTPDYFKTTTAEHNAIAIRLSPVVPTDFQKGAIAWIQPVVHTNTVDRPLLVCGHGQMVIFDWFYYWDKAQLGLDDLGISQKGAGASPVSFAVWLQRGCQRAICRSVFMPK
jgi:hypothetical protein